MMLLQQIETDNGKNDENTISEFIVSVVPLSASPKRLPENRMMDMGGAFDALSQNHLVIWGEMPPKTAGTTPFTTMGPFLYP